MLQRFLLAALICTTLTAEAQVVVDQNFTVTDLVQDILIGEGVDAFNVEINGTPGNQVQVQTGRFTDANGDIGLTDGIILATGDAEMAAQPNEGGGSTLGGSPSQFSFEPLENLVSVSVNDQCVIEFDFIPQGDTLEFRYVFASEEYNEYVCADFNDVFGFFISGPNPFGAAYDNENIALVPDPADPDNYTTTPVSINTVNLGIAGANGDPATCAAADPAWESYNIFYQENLANTYEYDGRTVTLTARAVVNCGDTYHISMAIGDGFDTSFDSAVFLEAGSFSSEPAALSIASFFPDGLVEISDQCDSASATIRRPCGSDTTYYVLEYPQSDSTATPLIDYLELPDSLFMEQGQTELQIPISAIPDGIVEDVEYLCITVYESANIDGPYTEIGTDCIAIIDSYTFPVDLSDEILYCPNAEAEFTPVGLPISVAPYTYEWSLNGTVVSDEMNFIAPRPENFGDSVTYDLVMVDFCGAVSEPTDGIVSNFTPGPTQAEIDFIEYCPGAGLRLRADREQGTFPFTYTWTGPDSIPVFASGQEFVEIMIPTESVDPFRPAAQTYLLTVDDTCTPTRRAQASYTFNFPEPLAAQFAFNDLICADQELDINVTASGGQGNYTYEYSATPLIGGLPDIESFVIDSNTGDGFAAGFFYEEMGENMHTINLDVLDACARKYRDSLEIFGSDPIFLTGEVEVLNCIYPNVVSPNGDGLNDNLVINEMINRDGTLSVFNRWGNLLSSSSDHVWEIDDQADGTYFYVVQYEDGGEEKGSFTIVR